MYLSTDRGTLGSYLRSQIEALYPASPDAFGQFDRVVDEALERTEACFARVVLPGYRRNAKPFYNHLHGDQSAVFTYFAANSAWRMGEESLAARFFLLNKMQNGLVCMYDTQMPDVFLLIHTVGTVLGKAAYKNFFVAYQNVTIGTESGRSPSIDEHVVVYGGSMVLGATTLGRGSIVSAQSLLIDVEVPPGSVAVGRSPDLEIKARKRDFAQQYWDVKP
ncbi:MAG TPA: hypothetical protein VMF11_09680 [Candidatus Baltobacteraceae bacterium]|nr:hypothetical protein [Candidatus Baltobacteraceae bacterium]